MKYFLILVFSLISCISFAQETRLSIYESRCTNLKPQILSILDSEGLSKLYYYLALAESGCKLDASSNQNATGLWQLTPYISNHYGLTINENIDERLDPVLATKVASLYLKSIDSRVKVKSVRERFIIVIASYNAGFTNIDRAYKKSTLGISKVDFIKLKFPESYRLAMTVLSFIKESGESFEF